MRNSCCLTVPVHIVVPPIKNLVACPTFWCYKHRALHKWCSLKTPWLMIPCSCSEGDHRPSDF